MNAPCGSDGSSPCESDFPVVLLLVVQTSLCQCESDLPVFPVLVAGLAFKPKACGPLVHMVFVLCGCMYISILSIYTFVIVGVQCITTTM